MRHDDGHLDWYLKRIGRVPLLTADQEIVLGRTIARWQALLEKGIESPSVDERRVIRAGERAFKKMMESNLRLVVNLANKYKGQCKHLDFTDLISEGNIGLSVAVRKFDYERGYKFSTYAYWWIRQSITRAVSQTDMAIRIPIHRMESLSKARTFTRQYLEETGDMPTKEQVAESVGLPLKDFQQLTVLAQGCGSLNDKPRVDNENAEILSLISSREQTVEEIVGHFERDQVMQVLPSVVKQLPPKAQEVVQLRFFRRTWGRKTCRMACLYARQLSVLG